MLPTIQFHDMFYFNARPLHLQPMQRVEWTVFRIREFKASLRHYIRLSLLGCDFVDVMDFIVDRLNAWYEDIFVILRDAQMLEQWPLLNFDWPVMEFL